jgi:acetyl esterase/lipase
MRKAVSSLWVLGVLLIAAPGMHGQGITFSAAAQVGYRVFPNITYITENNYDAKLDMYQARGQNSPQATVIYIHGGGWTAGSKEACVLSLLPYFEMGWNVVNVEYRLARVSLARLPWRTVSALFAG